MDTFDNTPILGCNGCNNTAGRWNCPYHNSNFRVNKRYTDKDIIEAFRLGVKLGKTKKLNDETSITTLLKESK